MKIKGMYIHNNKLYFSKDIYEKKEKPEKSNKKPHDDSNILRCKENSCNKEIEYDQPKDSCNNTLYPCRDTSLTCSNETKESPHSCYCSTDILKEILQSFKENNTPSIIFTNLFPLGFTPENIFNRKYIFNIIDDMIYLSDKPDSESYNFIIPISNINFIISVDNTIKELSPIIKKIKNKNTPHEDNCSGHLGISDAIKNSSNPLLAIPLTGGLLGTSSSLTLYANLINTLIIFITIFFNDFKTAVNNDICIFYSNTELKSKYIIIPTSKIDFIYDFKEEKNTNTKTKFTSRASGLLSLLPEDIKTKIEVIDFDKLFGDLKDKSINEILSTINSLII